MNIIKKFWTWLSQPEVAHSQPESAPKSECCGKCVPPTLDPVPTTAKAEVAEFYANDEGYAKAVYEDATPVVAPVVKKTRTPRQPAVIKKPAKKTPPAKKQTPKKKK